MHQSSSIDFPILFKKKILFITSNDINDKTYLGFCINKISNFFNRKPYNISENVSSNKLNDFIVNYNSKKYQLYKSLFIKHPKKNINNFYDLILNNKRSKQN